MLQIWFAGGIVNGCYPFAHCGCHYYIGGSRYRCFVKEDVCSFYLFGGDVAGVAVFVYLEFGSECGKSAQMCIKAARTYVVASRFCKCGFMETGKQRTGKHYASAKFGAL